MYNLRSFENCPDKLMMEKSAKDNKTMATVVQGFLELRVLGSQDTTMKGAEMVALFPGRLLTQVVSV